MQKIKPPLKLKNTYKKSMQNNYNIIELIHSELCKQK